MAPELSLPPSFHWASFPSSRAVCFRSNINPQRKLKTQTCLPWRSFPSSQPQSRGSVKVSPPQELPLPMLVRKSAFKERTISENNQPTDGRTHAEAAVFPSLSLSLIIFFPLPFPVCSCSVCVTERKLSSLLLLPLGVVLPLLLSSALPLNAEPGSHAACKYTQCAAVLHTFHRGEV